MRFFLSRLLGYSHFSGNSDAVCHRSNSEPGSLTLFAVASLADLPGIVRPAGAATSEIEELVLSSLTLSHANSRRKEVPFHLKGTANELGSHKGNTDLAEVVYSRQNRVASVFEELRDVNGPHRR